MKLRRDIFKVVPMKSPEAEDNFVDLPPAERLSLVWDLTENKEGAIKHFKNF